MARSWPNAVHDLVDESFAVERRVGHVHRADVRLAFLRHKRSDVADGAVAVVRQKDLIAGRKGERPQDRIYTRGGIIDEDQIVTTRAEEGRHSVCCLAQPRRAPVGTPTRSERSRSINREGWRSISSRIACCAASTQRGTAPTVP
jgi:hypothetical protein